MTASEIINALNGYRNGTYGGAKKSIMKGQVSRLSESDIIEIANYIGIDFSAQRKEKKEKLNKDTLSILEKGCNSKMYNDAKKYRIDASNNLRNHNYMQSGIGYSLYLDMMSAAAEEGECAKVAAYDLYWYRSDAIEDGQSAYLKANMVGKPIRELMLSANKSIKYIRELKKEYGID